MRFGDVFFIIVTATLIILKITGVITFWPLILLIIVALIIGAFFNKISTKIRIQKEVIKRNKEHRISIQKQNEIKSLQTETYNDPKKRYTKLISYLRNKQYANADAETLRIMLTLSGKEDYLSKNDVLSFPCDIFNTIDSLWNEYSKGKFGFTAQYEIWLKGGKLDENTVPKMINYKLYGWDAGQYTRPVLDPGAYSKLEKAYYPLLCLLNTEPFEYTVTEMFGAGNFMKSSDFILNDALPVYMNKFKKCKKTIQ